MKVEFDRYSLSIDGRRRVIRSGSLHYFRLPGQELWRDRLARMRDAGLNAVDLYYPWSYHCAREGDFDFDGIRDVDALHDLIEDAGLYLIARPGPYVCAELDRGGLPGWLLADPMLVPRCRDAGGYVYSPAFMDATRDWFEQIVPRFARRQNLILVQVENEYSVPGPFSKLPWDTLELVIRWLGPRRVRRIAQRIASRVLSDRGPRGAVDAQGQTSGYMRDLCELLRELGVDVPLLHNDVSARAGRQLDVDLPGLDRYPLALGRRDWRDDPGCLDGLADDEAATDAIPKGAPVIYPELQAGWFDGWGGDGYEVVAERLGADGVDACARSALAQRAAVLNWYAFCGGTNLGYMASPDVYTSYDYGAPIGENGELRPSYHAIRELCGFLERFETDFARSERQPGAGRWCPEHELTRLGPEHRMVFLANRSRQPRVVPTPEAERAELAPWEIQVRTYDADSRLVAVSPEPQPAAAAVEAVPPPLPRLERFTLCSASPQLDPAYDDSAWDEIPTRSVESDAIDMDALGLHYGFVWYRGTWTGPLDRLIFDARHCWSVWLNGERIGAGDQFYNPTGVGPDAARRRRIPVERRDLPKGRNALVILVESLGSPKGLADDFRNPRGLVHLDTGGTPVQWRYRAGLVRGERGMVPIVAFDGIERGPSEEVVLPYGWTTGAGPTGVALFETQFELDGIDPQRCALALGFDPGRGKANLYLNGHLIGRYWPERGPQRRFALPWGILRPEGENHLAVALWKRSDRAALGKLRLECIPLA